MNKSQQEEYGSASETLGGVNQRKTGDLHRFVGVCGGQVTFHFEIIFSLWESVKKKKRQKLPGIFYPYFKILWHFLSDSPESDRLSLTQVLIRLLSAVSLILLLFSCSVVSASLWPHGLQHTRLPYPSPSPGACSNSCPLSRWCYPTISSSVVPFSSRLQSFPASGSFLMNQSFTSGGQSIRASASASVLPMNIQDWFRLGWTGWISLQPKGLSRVFSNTTVVRTVLSTNST